MIDTNGDRGAQVRRVQQNILAASERRLLNWLCGKMPPWVNPDLLTLLGMIGAVMILAGYASSLVSEDWLWLCILGYALHWFGDSMDGSLARYRSIERPRYGYFLDHSCDGLATFMILLGIGLSPYVRLDVALIALAGYLLLCIHAFLAVKAFGEMRLSYLAAGPTELRIFLIVFTLSMLFFGDAERNIDDLDMYDYVVGIIGLALIALFIFQTARTIRQLGRIDP